ncbi:hypothetical protein FQZ97_906730 [compost metagenome]
MGCCPACPRRPPIQPGAWLCLQANTGVGANRWPHAPPARCPPHARTHEHPPAFSVPARVDRQHPQGLQRLQPPLRAARSARGGARGGQRPGVPAGGRRWFGGRERAVRVPGRPDLVRPCLRSQRGGRGPGPRQRGALPLPGAAQRQPRHVAARRGATRPAALRAGHARRPARSAGDVRAPGAEGVASAPPAGAPV